MGGVLGALIRNRAELLSAIGDALGIVKKAELLSAIGDALGIVKNLGTVKTVKNEGRPIALISGVQCLWDYEKKSRNYLCYI